MALEDARTAFGGRIEGAFAPDCEPVANVFVIKGVVGRLVSTSAIFRGIAWFLLMDLIAWPGLVLILPAAFGRI